MGPTATRSLVFLALSGALVVVGCKSVDVDQSSLEVVGADVHDFGNCRQEAVLSHVFTLANKSAIPVELVEIKTSCGCLVAVGLERLSATLTIQPGTALSLPIRLAIGGAQETVVGRIVVRYRSVTNGSGERARELNLRVRAEVEPDYRVDPLELDFGLIDDLRIQTLTQRLQVIPVLSKNLTVEGATTSSSFLTTSVQPTAAGRVDVLVTADLSGISQDKALDGIVIIHTNSIRVPRAMVRTRGRFLAPISFQPNSVLVGSDERGEIRRDLQITTCRTSRVLSARCPAADGVRVEVDGKRLSTHHKASIFVAEHDTQPIQCTAKFEIELFISDHQQVTRVLEIPIHRFHKGVSND